MSELSPFTRITGTDEAMVTQQLQTLYQKELVKKMENGAVVRQVLDTKTGEITA